jgi:hypothetical protein
MLLVEPTFICLLQPISYNPHCRQNWKNNTYQKKGANWFFAGLIQ